MCGFLARKKKRINDTLLASDATLCPSSDIVCLMNYVAATFAWKEIQDTCKKLTYTKDQKARLELEKKKSQLEAHVRAQIEIFVGLRRHDKINEYESIVREFGFRTDILTLGQFEVQGGANLCICITAAVF